MAGDWIKVEHVMPDKPEVGVLADALGISHDETVGKLVRFWIWCDQQSVSGRDLRATKSLVDRVVLCEKFAEKLIETGWMKETERGFSIRNFKRHNGKSAKKRALAAERKRTQRSQKSHARSVTDAGPEKRREEKRIEPLTNNISENTGLSTIADLIDAFQSNCGAYPPIPRKLDPDERAAVIAEAEDFKRVYGERAAAMIRTAEKDGKKPTTLKQAMYYAEAQKNGTAHPRIY